MCGYALFLHLRLMQCSAQLNVELCGNFFFAACPFMRKVEQGQVQGCANHSKLHWSWESKL